MTDARTLLQAICEAPDPTAQAAAINAAREYLHPSDPEAAAIADVTAGRVQRVSIPGVMTVHRDDAGHVMTVRLGAA